MFTRLRFALLMIALPVSVSAAFPKAQGFVTDSAGILDPKARAELAALLREVEQETTAEIALVTVPSLDGLTVEDYANRLFKAWGIGKKGHDNGVLVVAPTERKMRIEVGYGLEPVLPDGLAAPGFFGIGLGFRVKAFLPLLLGLLFGGTALALALLPVVNGTPVLEALVAVAALGWGFKKGASLHWILKFRRPPTNGGPLRGWVSGDWPWPPNRGSRGGSSGSHSSGGSSSGGFGGGSSGGGGASGSW